MLTRQKSEIISLFKIVNGLIYILFYIIRTLHVKSSKYIIQNRYS